LWPSIRLVSVSPAAVALARRSCPAAPPAQRLAVGQQLSPYAVRSAPMSTLFRSSDYTELDLELDAGANVLTVRFDREPRLNALSEVMGHEIHALIKQLKTAPAAGEVRCVVFTGTGRAFSTG
jgi:hypothetical protein